MELLFEEWRGFLDEKAASDISNLAMSVEDYTDSLHITLYDVPTLLDLWKTSQELMPAIRGYMNIGTSHFSNKETPCWSPRSPHKAWDVGRSAAIGKYGPLVYDIGLIMARMKGAVGVMPDRESLSGEAENVWAQYLKRGSGISGIKVTAKKLDAEPPDNETETTDDDCRVWANRNPAVNYIYSAKGTGGQLFQKLKTNHRKAIRGILKTNSNARQDEIETLINEEGERFFFKHYDG